MTLESGLYHFQALKKLRLMDVSHMYHAALTQAMLPQLLVCVLPTKGVPLYAEIKRITDIVMGVPSQCLQQKHIPPAKEPCLASVSMKINVKLGGSNTKVGPNIIK
ncbi:Eukaryotic translation initiation factor 2C [Podila clonocystis]|nr:Eukaryotic translation initiation factor 2C [Podila clonocystis]